jgi:hypothetical protein
MAIDGESGADGGATGGGAMDLIGSAGVTGGGAPGAAESGGAQPGAPAVEGGVADGSAAVPDWFEKVSAETKDGETSSNRDWLAAKGVKDLDGLTKIARDTERALRENGRIKVPGEDAKPEDIAAFKAAIGVPDKVDGYEIKAPEGVPLNEPLINSLRESALKHAVPKAAFEGLVTDFIKLQMDEAAAESAKQDNQAREWLKQQGAKANEQMSHIDAAARALSLTQADLMYFRSMPGGAGRALDIFSKLGAGMAEDTMITGGKGRFGVTGAEAQAELDRMKSDPEIQKKVMVVGSPERARWDRLNAAAAAGKAKAQEQL